jgi:hypothetical protein
MKATIPSENALMAMILRRCNLGAAAEQRLEHLEAAAWDFIAEEPTGEQLRHVLTAVGARATPAETSETPSARRLLRAHERAQQAGVPPDVLLGFTEESLRMALLLRDAFRRGYQLGRAQSPTRTTRRARPIVPH